LSSLSLGCAGTSAGLSLNCGKDGQERRHREHSRHGDNRIPMNSHLKNSPFWIRISI
jgi:hypothetical protein